MKVKTMPSYVRKGPPKRLATLAEEVSDKMSRSETGITQKDCFKPITSRQATGMKSNTLLAAKNSTSPHETPYFGQKDKEKNKESFYSFLSVKDLNLKGKL